jgi:hypothetical protein
MRRWVFWQRFHHFNESCTLDKDRDLWGQENENVLKGVRKLELAPGFWGREKGDLSQGLCLQGRGGVFPEERVVVLLVGGGDSLEGTVLHLAF